MNGQLKIHFLFAALVLSSAVTGLGQKAAKNFVDERNVRAEMNFLASDAMQGRGSGTQFERITAEYVGSQFMQFGLEPAGENGWDGRPTYVQTVNIARRTFGEKPFIKYGNVTLAHGGEIVVLRTNTDSATGSFEKLAEGAKPKHGAAVLIRAKEGIDQRASMLAAQNMAAAGASIVFLEETQQWRSGWANFASRLPSFTSTGAKPVVTIIVSTEAANALSNLADGTKIEFGGKLAPSEERNTWNAVGKVTGSDPTLASEVRLLSSHLDHLGVRQNTTGDDKIFN